MLAVAGIATIVVLPQGSPRPARLDAPPAIVESLPALPVSEIPAGGVPVVPASGGVGLAASAPVRVRVPALGVTSSVMGLGLERDGSMEVPPGAYPWAGTRAVPPRVSWDPRSSPVTSIGTANREPSTGYVGSSPGDDIVINRADGTVLTFRVERVEDYPKDDFPTAGRCTATSTMRASG